MKWYSISKVVWYQESLPEDPGFPFRLFKQKGEIAAISQWPIWYLAYIVFEEGKVRGNHYHTKKEECFYITAGVYNFYIRHRTWSKEDVIVEQVSVGDFIFIQPWWSHAFEVLAPWWAIEFCKQSFEDIWDDSIRDYVFVKE